MAIWTETVTASPCAGGAGTSTANATTTHVVNGILRAVHLAYLDSPPAGTTDVTIAWATVATAPPILTVTNAATDAWFFPMGAPVNTSGTAISNMGAPIPVCDYVKVTIAQANDNDGVTAILIWDDGIYVT